MLKKILIALGLSGTAPIAAEVTQWPELPESGFLTSRPATTEDVAEGNAIFSMNGASEGPIAVEIPQYAWWTDDDGAKHLVFLMQAEFAPDGSQIVGLRRLDGTGMAGTMPELVLLGTQRPN